jgi:radical SAM protein with 4Fe4S-binding SPASM domain
MGYFRSLRNFASSVSNRYLPNVKIGRVYSRICNLIKYQDWYFPQAFYIEIGQKCNRTCWYCPNVNGSKDGEMTRETFAIIIKRLIELKWSGVVGFHNLNEPLLDPRLEEYVSFLGRLPNCISIVVTNGDYLTLEKAKNLISLGVQRISISRHGPFTDEWDARISKIQKLFPNKVEITQVGKTVPILTHNQSEHKGLSWQGKCLQPTLACSIKLNGDVSLCCCDFDNKVLFGNVKDKSLLEILKTKNYRRIRRLLRNGVRATSICQTCSGVI